jgi:hypothetical protein
MAQQIRFRLDGTIYGGIANPMDFGVTVAEEPTLQYRFVSFDNDIRFIGDGYAYLNNLIESDCGCDLVSVDVEYLCGQTSWQRLCTGFIILAECVTNYDKCEITTKLFDNTFATLINNNKSIPFSLRSEFTKNLQAVTPPNYNVLDLYPPATGVYAVDDFVYGIRVEDAFTQLVACMTDNRVDVSAPAFASGTFEYLMVLNGRQILSPQVQVETVISFEELFLALRNKLNLSISSTLQSNGRPLLTIDYASNINNQTNTIDLISLSGVVRKQDTSRLYSSVNFGNQDFYEQWQCNSGDNACTFAQTPFFGFRDETFGILGNCNKDTTLDLVVKEVIFDTNIIEDIFVWGNQSYADNAVLINSTQSVVPTIYKATQGDPYSIGQTVYNTEFTNEEVAQYWIGGIPNSLQTYIQGFDDTDTQFAYDDNASPNQQWSVIFPSYTSFVGITGDFIKFADPVIANTNYLNTNTYRVPYSGVYSFTAIIVLDGIVAPDSRAAFASIMRYNSNDEFIQQIDGTIVTSLNINSIVVDVTAQFVCEAGDLIRADASVALLSAGPPLTQIILNSDTISGDLYVTQFGGSGQAFEAGDLQTYDPCDYKNYLYDFEAPLSMSQIQNILNNPSAPIKFSRTPTINNGITGLCNQVTIDSIIRQNASFTLRSSQKL